MAEDPPTRFVARSADDQNDSSRNLTPREFNQLMSDMGIESVYKPDRTVYDQVRLALAAELQSFEGFMRQLLDQHHDKLRATCTQFDKEVKLPESYELVRQKLPSESSPTSEPAMPGTKSLEKMPLSGTSSVSDSFPARQPHDDAMPSDVAAPSKSQDQLPELEMQNLAPENPSTPRARRPPSASITKTSAASLTKLHRGPKANNKAYLKAPSSAEAFRKLNGENQHFDSILRCVEWLERQEEPERSSHLAKLIKSKYFEGTCLVVILLHGALSAIRLDQEIHYLQDRGEAGALVQPGVGNAIESGFLIFYALELLAKLYIHKVWFFICAGWKWNVMDMFLVIFSSADLLMSYLGTNTSGNIVFLRQGRLLKLVRALRVLRAVRFLTELRQMMMALLSSLATLIWCIVLIIFIQYLFAMLFVSGFAEYIEDGHVKEGEEKYIMQYFGSVGKGIVSLFMAVTGGEDWKTYYDMIEHTGWWRAMFFLFYICFFYVAAVNIITGTFVDKAFKLAQPDLEQLMMDKMRAEQEDAQALKKVWLNANKDHDGSLSREEARELIEGPWQHILSARGIDTHDADTFYTLLTRGSDGAGIDVETFVSGCLHMKGMATSIEVTILEFKVDVLCDEVFRALDYLTRVAKESEDRSAWSI